MQNSRSKLVFKGFHYLNRNFIAHADGISNRHCRLGNSMFRLQNYYVEDWANNFMLQFEVDDTNAWYEHVKPIIDTGEFGDARVMLPEAVTGDTIITHVVDPSGVLLIFIQ